MMSHYEDDDLYHEIVPGLWQGGTDDERTIYRGSKRLPALNDPRIFDSAVSLCAYSLPMGWFVKELRYAFPDGPVDAKVYSEVEAVADWIFKEWKSGRRVLVRCQAGINRSSLVAVLVLLRDGWTVDDAIAQVRAKRNQYALSNKHFEKYLLKRGK